MKRFALLTLIVLFAAATAFGSGQQQPGQSQQMNQGQQSSGQQVLRVAAPPWIFKKFNLEEFAKQWEKAQDNVRVELIRADKWSAPTWITEFQQGSSSFDVFIGGTGAMLAPVIKGGWTEPLDGMLTGNMARDKFVAGFLAAGKYKKPDASGTNYPVMPFMGEVAVIGVNTALMKDAGLWNDGQPVPIPSWNEHDFFDWFGKLQDAAELGAHVQIWDREFMQYDWAGPLQAMTGNFVAQNGKGFDVSSDAAHRWLSYLQRMNKQGIGVYTTSDDAGYQKWKTGAAGSFYAAQSHVMELVSVTNDESDIAYIGWPGAQENGSVIFPTSVWMPKVTKHKELGKRFIREVVFSKELQQWGFNNYGKLPVIKNYYGDGITWFKDQMPTILNIAEHSRPLPVYADLEKYLDILQKYVPEAAFGRMSVDKALSSIQQDIQDLDFSDLRAYD